MSGSVVAAPMVRRCTTSPLSVFLSYSHRDRQYRDRLKVALAQLRRDGLITEWDDQMISAGDEWDESIQHALASADLVLLLVSPDFIASNYSYDNELAKALARHERGDVRIIPIILRPADWHSAPFAHLQALPTGARAVTEWSNRDRAWADIAAGIRRVASEATVPSAPEDEANGVGAADGTDAGEASSAVLAAAESVRETPTQQPESEPPARPAPSKRDWAAGVREALTLWPHKALRELTQRGVRAVVFAPDGSTLAPAGDDRMVSLWDAVTGDQLRVFDGHTRAVTAVAFTPSGLMLASGSLDETVRLWLLETGRQAIVDGTSTPVHALAFSPDGEVLASAHADGTVRLADPGSGRVTHTLELHSGPVQALAFSPDGSLLASAGSSATIVLWDRAKRSELRELHGHKSIVIAVAFAPDNSYVASAGLDSAIRLWDLSTDRQIKVIEGHVNVIAFAPQGDVIASGGDDGRVRLWDVSSGRQLHEMQLPRADVINAVAFSSDGARLACGTPAGLIRVWEPATMTPVLLPRGATAR